MTADIVDDFNKEMRDAYFKAEETAREGRKRWRHSRKVAGRMKLAAGKKARAENKGSTEFEMELVHYLTMVETREKSHVFRSPASKTPVDVWMIQNNIEKDFASSLVYCFQCKTTRDTKPPRINKKELEEFRAFCSKINATAYWVDRWKKNKGQYIRRIRKIDSIDGKFYPITEDFSRTLNQTG